MGELLRVAAAAHGGQKPGTSDSVLPGNPPPLAQRRRRLNVYSHAVPPWDVRSCITLSLSLWLFFRRLLCVIALCPSLSLSLSSLLPIPSCTLPLSLWPFHRRLLSLSLSVCCSLSLSLRRGGFHWYAFSLKRRSEARRGKKISGSDDMARVTRTLVLYS